MDLLLHTVKVNQTRLFFRSGIEIKCTACHFSDLQLYGGRLHAQNKGGSQRINMTLPACLHCTDLDFFLTSKRYMKGRKWAAEEKEKINRQCFFTCNSGCCSPMCVPCADFALKVPQLFFIECPIIAGGRWRERGEGSDSSSTL